MNDGLSQIARLSFTVFVASAATSSTVTQVAYSTFTVPFTFTIEYFLTARERTRVRAPSRVGYLHTRGRGPATPPTYLLSEAVKIYMYVGLVA